MTDRVFPARGLGTASRKERMTSAHSPSGMEAVFAGFVLLLSSSALIVLLPSEQVQGEISSPVIAAAWAAIGVVSMTLLYAGKPGIIASLSDWVLWPLILLPFLSTFWSIAPFTTLKRSIALAATVAFGIYFGNRFPVRRQMRILAHVLSLAAVASLLAVWLLPSIGIMHEPLMEGTWRGVFPHKNVLGLMMSLNCIALVSLPPGRKTLMSYALLVLSVVLVLGSRSMSSLVVLLAIGVIGHALRGGPKRMRRWALLPAMGVLPFLCGLDLLDLPGYLGRSATLSGRVPLWLGVMLMIARRPLLGYGYSAFWSAGNPDCLIVWRIAGWQAPNAHNSFLDLLLQMGAAGLVLFLLVFLCLIVRAWSYFRLRPATSTVFPLLILIFMLLGSLDESVLLTHNGIQTILMISLATAMRRIGDWHQPSRRRHKAEFSRRCAPAWNKEAE